MTTARDIMTKGAEYVDGSTTVLEAAKKLAAEDFGALPICDGDKLIGMVAQADLALSGNDRGTGDTVEAISK